MRNGQAYQRETEKFFVSEEKKFGKIDSWLSTTISWFPKILQITCLLGGFVRLERANKGKQI